MKITRLKDHSLLNLNDRLADVREYIAKCDPCDPNSDPPATRREKYAIETFMSVSNIVSCIDQLHFSIGMLSGYRADSAPEKMNRVDYIVFGIENYYLRLTSVFDRCLRLANVIYQLGLPEQACNNDSIIKNNHVKGTPAAKTLKELDNFTSPFRFHRNIVAHHGTYFDNDINHLGSYYCLADGDDGFGRYRHLYKNRTDDFVVEKKTEFKAGLVKLENLVESYFDDVVVAFESRLAGILYE